jgi:probable F420-dependent oxidoreductase
MGRRLMEVGLCSFSTDWSIRPADLGRLAEERGFESLFLPEHTHIPVSRETPYPAGGALPAEYSHTLDPFVGLASVAAVTERLKLGFGVVLVIQRDPIVMAKEVATLDMISNGRVLFGVGAGWNLEEMRNHGTDPDTRFGLMRERVEAMKAIWTEDEAEYHGRHVDFDPVLSWPKPVTKPHPPVLVGGMSDGALNRVVRYGDEWMPNVVVSPEILAGRIADLQQRASDAGRGPIPVTLFAAKPEVRALNRLREAGVDRALILVRSDDAASTEARLDELAGIVAEAWAA